MKDNNTEFSDFFKKKLEEVENTGTKGWDKPGTSVKKAVLHNISKELSTTTTSTRFSLTNLLLIGITTALLLTIAGIFNLHKQNKNLRKILNNKVTYEKEAEIITQLKAKHTNEVAALQQEKSTTLLQKNNIVEENELLTKQLAQQKRALAQLGKDVRVLSKLNNQHKLDKETLTQNYLQSIKRLDAKVELNNKYLLNPIANATAIPSFLTSPVQAKTKFTKLKTPQNPSIPKLPKLSSQLNSNKIFKLSNYKQDEQHLPTQLKRKRFEIGYTYTQNLLDSENENSLNDQSCCSKVSESATFGKLRYNGIRFAFSPYKNIWINTGISYFSTMFSNSIEFKSKYFTNNEVSIENNKFKNEISFSTIVDYSEFVTPIYFQFEREVLNENDNIYAEVIYFQNLRFYRIPFGLDYYYGRGRLQGVVSGGILYSKVSGLQNIYPKVLANNTKSLYVQPTRAKEPKGNINVYGGLGLNYRLFKNLHARAGFSLNYRFQKMITQHPKITNIDIGLYYRL